MSNSAIIGQETSRIKVPCHLCRGRGRGWKATCTGNAECTGCQGTGYVELETSLPATAYLAGSGDWPTLVARLRELAGEARENASAARQRGDLFGAGMAAGQEVSLRALADAVTSAVKMWTAHRPQRMGGLKRAK